MGRKSTRQEITLSDADRARLEAVRARVEGCAVFDSLNAYFTAIEGCIAHHNAHHARPSVPMDPEAGGPRRGVQGRTPEASGNGIKFMNQTTRDPPDMTVAGFVVPAGFHPSKRRPLPGTRKFREGIRVLSSAVIAIQVMRNRDRSRSQGEEKADSSVLD